MKSLSFYPRSGLRCQLDGFVPVWDLYESRLPTIFTRTVVRARHRVVMILLHVVTCTATLDNMPGGLLDKSFLVGGMDMHACTVDSAITSTQHPSPTPSVPSRSLASFQIAVFAPEGGTLSAESGVRFPIFVCDWGNWPYPFAGQLGQLLPNVQPASPLLVHELLSGPYGSPLYPYTSSAVAGLVAFSHSSARSPHLCDHFHSTSRLF